jgi:hypothetical protein
MFTGWKERMGGKIMFTRDFNRECKSGNHMLSMRDEPLPLSDDYEEETIKQNFWWYETDEWWANFSDGGI